MNIEQTKEAIRIMQAFVDGKEVEWDCRGIEIWETIISPKWNWIDNKYRIKPTPVLRPWTADEVPLGAWMRKKQEVSHRWVVIDTGGGLWQQAWFEDYEHSTDGGKTWKECGVMEECK